LTLGSIVGSGRGRLDDVLRAGALALDLPRAELAARDRLEVDRDDLPELREALDDDRDGAERAEEPELERAEEPELERADEPELVREGALSFWAISSAGANSRTPNTAAHARWRRRNLRPRVLVSVFIFGLLSRIRLRSGVRRSFDPISPAPVQAPDVVIAQDVLP
jgi:hypothetical protein